MPARAFVPIAAALACAACGSSEEAAVGDSGPIGTGGAAPPTVASQRDVSGIKGCEVVRGSEVVTIAGGTKLSLPPTANPGGCMYVVEMADGAGESYQFRYDGSGVDRALIEHFTPEESMRRVEGPWDDGRIGPQPLGGGTRFVAVRGDVGIEVTGDREEPMIEIAKLAASRAP
jgi:hypothetical protein